MELMDSSLRRLEPRVATRLHRNHFNVDAEPLTDASERLQSVRDEYVSRQIEAAEKASEAMQTYRYNIVNAIFNDVNLAGDSPNPEDCVDSESSQGEDTED